MTDINQARPPKRIVWCDVHRATAAHPNTICWRRATAKCEQYSDDFTEIMRELLAEDAKAECVLVEYGLPVREVDCPDCDPVAGGFPHWPNCDDALCEHPEHCPSCDGRGKVLVAADGWAHAHIMTHNAGEFALLCRESCGKDFLHDTGFYVEGEGE